MEPIEAALGVNPLLEFNESLNLALVAPEIFWGVVRPLAIVEIDVSLAEAGHLTEKLVLLDEPAINQGTEVGVGVGSLKYSA